MQVPYCCPISLTHLFTTVLIPPAQTGTEAQEQVVKMRHKSKAVFTCRKHLLSLQMTLLELCLLVCGEEKENFPKSQKTMVTLSLPQDPFTEQAGSGDSW